MIIDFRMRPPARGFLNIGVYDNVERTAKLTECFSMKQAPSVAQKSPELMLQEMDTAGVTMGVIPGRNGHFKGTISNDDIIKLLGDFPGRFVGTAGLNASKKEEAIDEIERTVLNGPLKGVSMEPGALDKPMYADDPRIYPIYEKCEKHQIPVILMLGGRAGPDITYSDPKIINRIAADFPKTNFIISHGGWPWVQQILGVCFFHIPLPGHVPLQLQRSGRLHHGRQQLHAGPLPLRLSLSADAHRGLRGALQDVVQAGSPAETDVEKRCKSTQA